MTTPTTADAVAAYLLAAQKVTAAARDLYHAYEEVPRPGRAGLADPARLLRDLPPRFWSGTHAKGILGTALDGCLVE